MNVCVRLTLLVSLGVASISELGVDAGARRSPVLARSAFHLMGHQVR